MKCWLHKWILKKAFCTGYLIVRGFECSRCGARKIKGSSCASHITWNEAINWRDQQAKPRAQVLRIVKSGNHLKEDQ